MTPQVLHAMLASGWLMIGSERLNVSPKTTEEIIFWLQQEEGLTECTFEQLDMATQYSLLSHNQYCLEMGMPQRNLCDYRFFCLPRGEKTEFLYTAFERTGFGLLPAGYTVCLLGYGGAGSAAAQQQFPLPDTAAGHPAGNQQGAGTFCREGRFSSGS